MRAPRLLPLTVAALMAAAAAPAQAAPEVDLLASGLDNPRHLALDKSGRIYVAEAGRGGGEVAAGKSCFDSAEGLACTGATGAVTRVGRHGRGQKRIVTGLASFASALPASLGNNAIGPHGITVKGGRVYVTNGGPTGPTRGTPPEVVLRDPTLVDEDPVSALYGRVLKVRPGSGRVQSVADVWAFERGFNADAGVGNPLVDSNAVDVLLDRGNYIVADAGGNTVLRADPSGLIRPVAIFPNVPTPGPGGATIPMQAVPTGVVKGPDGAYYVSQLTGFPFPVGGAKVFRVDPASGAVTDHATGFTNAMDLDFGRDGTLYVLEIDSDSLFPPVGPKTDGGIWAVPPGGGTPERIALPAGTLTEPGGIAVGRRNTLYVTNNSTKAGGGQVLSIRLDD